MVSRIAPILEKRPQTPKCISSHHRLIVNECQQTEIEQLQTEITQLKSQLDRCQKMTALGELVSTTTHEFNNVLMTIMNYAKMGMKAFAKINDASNRAAKITNSVLGMARNRSCQFEPTNLAKIVDETMVLLERELQKYRVSVEQDIAEVPEVSAMGNQIQQVLLNLLVNDRQAMPDGGRLILKLEHDQTANNVDLSVRDFGVGMNDETMRKIFVPWYTTKCGPDESGKGGTGLGLSACKNIIEAHGGKIRGAVGKGTKFTIKLPVEKQTSPVPAARGITGAVSSLNAATSVS